VRNQPLSRFDRHRTGALAGLVLYGSVAALYLTMGAIVLLYQRYWQGYPTELKVAFGVLCLAYGAFRAYRAIQTYQEKVKEERNV
jgi:hypothetical protein